MLSALKYILLLLRVQEIGFSNNQYYFSQIQTKEITMTIIFAKHRFFKIVKHLMTCPKVNREFCFPETLNVPQGKAEGNVEIEEKQTLLFPHWTSH